MLHVLYNHKKFKEVQYNLINYSDLILLNNHKKQEQLMQNVQCIC